MHGNSLLTTPGHFGTVLLPYVSKNDEEKKENIASQNNLTSKKLITFHN